MTTQARTYLTTDFTNQTELVAQVIKDHPEGITAKAGALLLPAPKGKTEFPEGRFTARAGDLLKQGRVYTSDTGMGKRYHYVMNPAEWPAFAQRHKAESHPVTKLVNRYKKLGLITPELRDQLADLYREAVKIGK